MCLRRLGFWILSVISGFRRDVDKTCALLGYLRSSWLLSNNLGERSSLLDSVYLLLDAIYSDRGLS